MSLNYIESERKVGAVSIFRVRCHNCLILRDIPTDTQSVSGRYTCNLKLASGMLDSGSGPTQINTLFSAVNVPHIHTSKLKAHERIVSPAINKVAKESCSKAIEVEKSLTLAACKDLSPDQGPIPIKGSIDAGWTKRGAGHSYDSKTGQCSLNGHESGLCLGYATRKKGCSLCARGRPKSDHKCNSNYDKSSKSMEADMVVELVTRNPQLTEKGVRIGTLIGDDDSCTIAAVRRESEFPVEKWSDINHSKKILGSHLYFLKEHSNLPAMGVQYFKTNFGYILAQNRNDAPGTAAGLINSVEHAFDNHENCSAEWCNYLKNPTTYKHQVLPSGKGLSGPKLKTDLSKVLKKFADNAEQLAPGGSTQSNESFNMIVASKNPKNKYYGGTESFDTRVAAAVAQKNEGTSYILAVNETLPISPGENTLEFRKKKDEIRKYYKAKRVTKEAKSRRQLLKKEKTQTRNACKRKEGVSYDSGCALDGVGILPDATYQGGSVVNPDSIPVFFDLETSGRGRNTEICQIAAVKHDKSFSVYIIPERGISAEASSVNGLTVCNGELFWNGAKVDTKPPLTAVRDFISFLKSVGNNVVLVAHNGDKFDDPHMVRLTQKLNLADDFIKVVVGFTDSLKLLHEKLPERKKEKKSFSLVELCTEYLGPDSTTGAHNAVFDTQMLERLVGMHTNDAEIVAKAKQRSVAMSAVRKSSLVASLQSLPTAISKGMIGKLAAAGISLSYLKEIYKDRGEKGIQFLLTEDVSGKPRITKNSRIIKSLIEFLSKNASV